MGLLDVLEAAVGRRLLWKIGRRIYLHARRQGSLDFERNGERALQEALARRSALQNTPLNVVDIGANHGQWATSLLRELRSAHAPKADLTLFEPVPDIRAGLIETVAAYADVAEVRVEPLALSDSPGTARLVVTGFAGGDHHLTSDAHQLDGSHIDVEVDTLDRYAARGGLTRIDMVKIDAEGFDAKVVQGMRGLLEDGAIDVVQFEYSGLHVRSRSFLHDYFEVANACGYNVGLLTRQGIELHRAWHLELERFYLCSMLLVHPRAREILPSRFVEYGPDNTHD